MYLIILFVALLNCIVLKGFSNALSTPVISMRVDKTLDSLGKAPYNGIQVNSTTNFSLQKDSVFMKVGFIGGLLNKTAVV